MERLINNAHLLSKRTGGLKNFNSRHVSARDIFLKKFHWIKLEDDEDDAYVPRKLSEHLYTDSQVTEVKLFNFKGSNNDWY